MVNMALRFVVMTMCCITCCSCIESCAWGRPWNASDKSIVLGFMSNYQRTKVYLGAISLAVETVNNSTDLLPGYRLELEVMNTADKYNLKTLRSQPMTFMTKLLMERNVAAFIGPDEYCTTEAKVASAWNRPMISFKCVDPDVSNKQAFPTFARTNPPSSTVTKSVISLLHSFKWRKFAIVTSSSPKWVIVSDTIKTQAYNENVTVTGFHFYPTDYFPHHHKQNMSQIVDRTYQKTRIYVFVGEHVALFDFLICLQEHKLLDTGDYMVISVDDIEYNPKDMSNYFHRDYLDKYTMSNQRPVDLSAFRFLLKVAMTRPEMNPNYEHIAEQIKNYSFRSPFAVPYHKILVANLSVPVEGAYLYDAVMLYARAATEVLREKGNILNGTTLMRKIFKSTYHSVVGYDVRIDAQGNAEGNYTVLALLGNWNNLQGPNASRLEIIGNFVYNASHSVPVFNYVNPQREALWKKGLVKGALPKDEPLCGFFGQKCPRHEPSWRVYLILSFIAFVLLVIAAFAIKYSYYFNFSQFTRLHIPYNSANLD